MIYYVIKINFVNNLLVSVEGFNRYQSSGKKKGRAVVESGPRRLENLGLPLRYTVLSIGLAARALKYKHFSSLRHRFLLLTGALGTFQLLSVVALRYRVEFSPGTFGAP